MIGYSVESCIRAAVNTAILQMDLLFSPTMCHACFPHVPPIFIRRQTKGLLSGMGRHGFPIPSRVFAGVNIQNRHTADELRAPHP